MKQIHRVRPNGTKHVFFLNIANSYHNENDKLDDYVVYHTF